MAKRQVGVRDLQKQLWKLAILEFAPGNQLHTSIAGAGRVAAQRATRQLEQLRQEGDNLTVTIVRRELRKWLRESPEGAAVEAGVGGMLAGGGGE